MDFDAERDLGRWRRALLLASCICLAVVVTIIVDTLARSPSGREARMSTIRLGAERARGETVERCGSCHPDEEEGSTNLHSLHGGLLETHRPEEVGCAVCHGGTARATEREVAHALAGTRNPDPLMTEPFVQASCLQCHTPGGVTGTAMLARGAREFYLLGCALCHPLRSGGRGGWADGPDLAALGRKETRDLEESLLEPALDFPGTTMPSYREVFEKNPNGRVALLVYLHALTLPLARGARADEAGPWLVEGACTRCHGGPTGVASGMMEHGCVFIREHQAELDCASCHSRRPILDPAKPCPLVEAHRDACVACHRDIASDRGGSGP